MSVTKPTKKPRSSKLSNDEAWAQATDETRASWGRIGDVSDSATEATLPPDDVAFWDAVELRAVELGGRPVS